MQRGKKKDPRQEKQQDQIFELIGKIGKWQCILIFLVGISGVPVAWQILVMTFLTPSVKFFCTPQSVYEGENNRSFDEWTSLAKQILPENATLSKCTVTSYYHTESSLVETNQSCSHWTYDTSFFPRTVITQFDLVCSYDYMVTVSQSVFMLGILFGAVTSGITSDRFGRKPTIMASSFGLVIFGVGTSFASSVGLFVGLRFCAAFFTIALFTTGYCMELVGDRWSVVVGIGLEFFWAIGYALLPALAYALPDWSSLQLTISLPLLLFLAVAFVIPESPRWLLAEGRLAEAEDVLERAVEVNGGEWPEGRKLVALQGTETSASFLDLFRTPNMRRKTLVQYFLWFTCAMVYYGLTLNPGSLLPGADLHLSFLVGALMEFPAYALTMVVLLRCGRRVPLSAMMFFGGVALLLTLAVPEGAPALATATAGKFGLTAAFAAIYLSAAELFPTVLRNSGLGSASMCARVGSILAPVVARELAQHSGAAAPVGVFASFAMAAGVLALLLPETKGRRLPESVEEGEAFGKEDKLFWWSKTTKMAVKVGEDNDGYD